MGLPLFTPKVSLFYLLVDACLRQIDITSQITYVGKEIRMLPVWHDYVFALLLFKKTERFHFEIALAIARADAPA